MDTDTTDITNKVSNKSNELSWVWVKLSQKFSDTFDLDWVIS